MDDLRKRVGFFKTAVGDPGVAAIATSSRFVIRNVLRRVPEGATTIIEYGPGEGVLTRPLLSRLPADGTLIAIESNHDFAESLRRINDPRLRVLEGKVEDILHDKALLGIETADFVASSIPFSFLSPDERAGIASETARILVPGGRFVVFHQYSPLMQPVLKQGFGKVTVDFEFRNVFPCFIIEGVK